MPTISVNTEKALDRLNRRLADGENLLQNIRSEEAIVEFEKYLDEYASWRSKTIDTFKQIFTDSNFAIGILDRNDTIFAQYDDLERKVNKTSQEISNDIEKVKSVIGDINEKIYAEEGDKEKIAARRNLINTIIVAIITTIGGIIAGYVASPDDSQGLKNLKLEGKWKYICTSFDNSYQHGGRFTVQKETDGTLLLTGERMWKDIKDAQGNWTCTDFPEASFAHWRTNWIYVKNDSELFFEYKIPGETNDVLGYCASTIDKNDNGVVTGAIGNFYVLNQKEKLTGSIKFVKVDDKEYESKKALSKNHDNCNH